MVSVRHIDDIIAALLARGYLVLGPVAGPGVSVDNHVVFFDGVTGRLIKDSGLTLAGNNTGDQTSIVGITGTLAEFNAALTGADFATGGGTATGSNTGDQFTNTTLSTLLGRRLGSNGPAEEITLGTNLSMSGTTLNAAGGAGGGDVTGPAGATNNRVVFFDGATGKLIKDNGITLTGTNTGDQTLVGLGGQPLDTGLTTLAGLAGNANDLIVGDGGGPEFAKLGMAANQFPARASVGGLTAQPITDFALTLVDDANAATMRATLGLVIGTNVQAWSTKLDAVAALVATANDMVIGNGAPGVQALAIAANQFPARASAGALSAQPITDFGLSLVDDANAATARTTLGVVIGTNVQAWDTDLDTLSGLAPNANDILVGNAGTYAKLTIAANQFPARTSVGGLLAKAITDAIVTFLGTPSSANLLAALSDKTGTGLNVFGTSPALATPTMTSPATTAGTVFRFQATPISKAAAATLTNSELLNGLIQYTGAAANLTLPTGTLMDTGAVALTPLFVGMSFKFSINNTSAATVTLVAGATFTIVGTATTLTGIVSEWTCYRTAVNTWVAFRS